MMKISISSCDGSYKNRSRGVSWR